MNALVEHGFASPATCGALVRQYEDAAAKGLGFVYAQRNITPRDLGGPLADAVGERLRIRLEAAFDVDVDTETQYVTRLDIGQSHVAHADCERREGEGWVPNHTAWRTFSAVLYLNDDFDGGEFFFTDPYLQIAPVTGLLVAFPADRRFEHGVRQVRAGRRYTMPMWFR